MSRCNYDGVFHRVFCVTLLAIALTFTIILTNVFIDIDGLLASKDKEDRDTISTTAKYQDIENNEVYFQQGKEDKGFTEGVYQTGLKEDAKDNIDVYHPFDNQDQESYDLKPEADEDYRTKRSIDTPNNRIDIHFANPKMKEYLNNRLSTLLEELDAEESQAGKEEKQKMQEPAKLEEPTTPKTNSEEKERIAKEEQNKDILHLAMHNILLEGIIGHMDLNEVYHKVHGLIQNLEGMKSMKATAEVREPPTLYNYPEIGKQKRTEESQEQSEDFSVESKFFDELMKCEELQKQINTVASAEAKLTRISSRKTKVKVPKMLIKTIIDIKTLNKNKEPNNSNAHENSNNIRGLIKLIYNGKSINFSRLDDDDAKNKNQAETIEHKDNKLDAKTTTVTNNEENIVDTFLDKALAQYLKKYPSLENKFKDKRLKRSVKVRKHVNSVTEKPKKKEKPDEEELYVEIETHFDSKGDKGDKKKKLIKAIIAKIQKALRVNIDTLKKTGKTNKKLEMLQIKKRLQNPLKLKEEKILTNKIILPIKGIILRKSEPISKSIKLTDQAPKVYDQMGEIWKRTYTGSNFLSNAKSINSGEMGQVDLDYSRVVNNGIPQRLQQPLNSENIDQIDNNEYYNLGDLKFYIKEIDGTGFSIGFNQYVGDAPDSESIKLFTGLQQLINVYNQDVDNATNAEYRVSSGDGDHVVSKRDVSGSGSIFDNTPKEPRSEEYTQLIFGGRHLPYDSYSEIIEDGHNKVSFSIEKEDKAKQSNSKENNNNFGNPLSIIDNISPYRRNLPFIIDENLFKKPLKPSEIFGLANLLNRKKRSPIIKIKKYSNMKTKRKPHINRYLNTKRKAKMIVKNKRNKRQVDKIRIIATDSLPHMSRNSDENYYVVSEENMFADRAVIREIDEQEQSEREEHHDFVVPHHIPSSFSPYKIFGSRSRQNALMSKYPHLFLEEITRSKEDDGRGFYSKLMENYGDFQKNEATPSSFSVTPFEPADSPYPRYQSADIYDGSDPRPNYKLTVKIIPKNLTEVPTGFKSVHTSINKTINRNGILFLSQVNVSEMSKFENLNGNTNINKFTGRTLPESGRSNLTEQVSKSVTQESKNEDEPQKPMIKIGSDTFPLVKHIKEQQEKMKMLLKQHKQRIEEQLDNLKQEKQNIDSMIIRGIGETTTAPPEVKKSETIDVLLPLNPPQMLHLNKDEAGQLISNALMKLHDAPHLNDISEKIQPNFNKQPPPNTTTFTTTEATTTSTQTTTSTTTTQQPRRTVDPERLKLLRTIQRNENLTNVILYKIDRNTNLLQHFLQKLADRLEPITRRPEFIDRIKFPDQPKEWRNGLHDQIFSQALPNMEVNKNATHVSIPFVYAYQQPYPLPAANNPVASVVYQGHIHTNAFNNGFNKSSGKSKLPDKREANNTKFFLDDVEPGFKVVPVPIRKEPYDIPRIKNNVTVGFKNRD